MAKVNLAVKLTGIRKVSASGGVSANNSLREALSSDKRFRAWLPSKSRCTDNAAMIAAAGINSWLRGIRMNDVMPDPSLHDISGRRDCE